MPRPMPSPAPVMMATRSCSRLMLVLLAETCSGRAPTLAQEMVPMSCHLLPRIHMEKTHWKRSHPMVGPCSPAAPTHLRDLEPTSGLDTRDHPGGGSIR